MRNTSFILKALLLAIGCLSSTLMSAQEIARSGGGDCTGNYNEFYLDFGTPCSGQQWFISGTASYTIDYGDVNSTAIGLTWTSAGSISIYTYYQCSSGCCQTSALNLTINSTVTSSVLLTGPSSIEYPSSAEFTATPTNGGSSPVYAFYVNSTFKQSGSSNTFITSELIQSNNTVRVSLNPTVACYTSSYVDKPVTVTGQPVTPAPTIPTVATNTCGPKILTMTGTPPSNVTWYWQGLNNPNGESLNSSPSYTALVSGDYYIRAKHSNTLWSTATKVNVDIDPVDITVPSYDPVNTLVQATHSITLTEGFIVTAGNEFTAKIAITSECNDKLNWSEEVAYDQNGQPMARNKLYADGMGDILQTQAIDKVSGKVWVSQPLYNNLFSPVASTLSAPILEHDFIYKSKFVSNASGTPYSTSDFDLPVNTGAAGEINNPKPVGTAPGTLGWYYSSSNNLEPFTAITSYPYSRSWTPEGPNPTTSKSAGLGENHKMGSGHEAVSEKQKATSAELSHYLSLCSHFVSSSVLTYSGDIGYKSITADPNDNTKKAVAFTDINGLTLATATLTGSTYSNWSYSYYNDLGQVVAQVAPNGVNTGSTAYPSFVTLYEYDQIGRLITVTSPDEGVSRFVYSTDGKIRFSQNQEQFNATPKRFSYTNYDYLGRPIESGEYTSTSGGYVFDPHTGPVSGNSVLSIIDNIGFTGTSFEIDASRCGDYSFIYYDYSTDDLPTDALHLEQTNLYGQVTKTKNASASTWYSYDEFGQLSWTKQDISGLGTKTIDYTFDYFGNATEAAYQKNQTDAFYHHYVYDGNQRLTEVYTSKDGTTKKLQARYEYYLHGPLKRVEFANELQGIDYTYTITGALKTINHADPAKDPGGDGTDIFGETLNYYDNDYQGAGYSAGGQTLTGYSNQFGGAIKGVSWHSPVDNHAKRTYAFSYDPLYQLQNAIWGDMTGSAGSYGFTAAGSEKHREGVPSYDKNGNIQSLIRKGKDGNTLGNYDYVYHANTNKVDYINHNSIELVDYSYNSIGQMTQQDEGGAKTFNVTYNAYELVKEVRNASGNLTMSYAYDDRGDLIKRTNYNDGTAISATYYVSDASGNTLAIYEQVLPSGTATLAEVPIYGAGRVALYKPQVNTYFYEVNDHLGNVRGVIGTIETDSFTATMESEISEEIPNKPFKNIAATRVVSTAANHTVGGNEVVRLNNSAPAGPGTVLKVSPGDVINLETYAYYEAGVYRDYFGTSSTIISSIASVFGGVSGGAGEAGKIFSGINGGFGDLYPGAGGGVPPDPDDDDRAPYAYLAYMIFDVNMVYRYGGYTGVTTSANMAKERLHLDNLAIDQPGFMYVFVFNRSESTNWVYFDDLTFTHQHSPIVAGSDYYPFGLPMEGRRITDEAYRWAYQGQFSEENATTGWNEFELRMYDARFGRWLSVDPEGQYASPYVGMGNTPNLSVDADGGWSWITAGIGVAVGAGIGYAITGDLEGAVVGGLAGGLLGGVSFNQGRNSPRKFNGGYREYGGLSLEFNSKFYKSIGNAFSNFSPKLPSSPAYFNLLILHDPWDPKHELWGELDGHVFIDDNGTDYSFRPTNNRNGRQLQGKGLLKNNDYLWHSDGWVGSEPTYAASTRTAELRPGGHTHSELRVKTTATKKKALLNNIQKAALNPPDYSTLGKRCAGFAMKMMRKSKIVPWHSKFHQITPRVLENFMERRPGVTRVFP